MDEQIYDWAVEKFADYQPEWFCQYGNLRMIDEKLKEYGHKIKDTHVYFLPECQTEEMGKVVAEEMRQVRQPHLQKSPVGHVVNVEQESYLWYDQEEILKFQENNHFTSAICFSRTQPDMMAVAALKSGIDMDSMRQGDRKPNRLFVKDMDMETERTKVFDQSLMSGMAGVSADGQYLWQIGINVIPEEAGKGLAAKLVRMMKERVLAAGKIPFYGTSESHTISQTVGLKAGFVPAWTEVYARQEV